MLWVDQKYIGLMSHRLRNFKRKSAYLYNFSCPFCGDSKTRRSAARGYVYKKNDQLNFDCKKCGKGISVKNFIKELDPNLYQEMQLELYKPPERETIPDIRPERPVFDTSIDPYKGLIKISDLPSDHFCRKYVEDRCIPLHVWDDLYFTPTFYTWSGYILPGRYRVPKDARDDEPRLVIPLRNVKGNLTAFQGRQLQGEDKGQKYVFVALTKDEPLIWGLERIDLSQNILVFEGPIDAMFMPNSIACGGGDLSNDLMRLAIPKEKFIVVYDNEPRKSTTIAKIQKAINKGFAVCIWPEMIETDVNDMVKKHIKNGLSEACQYVFTKINQGIYSGVAASLALSSWNRTKK